MPDKIALEGFSFTTTEGEAAAIYFMLKTEGLEPNSQGLKEFLLRTAGASPGGSAEEDGDEDLNEEDLSEKVRRIIEVAERNPEVTQYAIKKGAQLLGTLLKRLG
jgi:hypothetical protein